MEKSIADLRKEYSHKSLLETEALSDPMQQFSRWWDEAIQSRIEEANAMTLATASSDGLPSARIVLLKGFTTEGFTFYTNYESFKAQQLAENPRACLVFFWKELERQVRITGVVSRVNSVQSDEYFISRPESSRVGAIVSPQSRVIESREWLDARFREFSNARKDLKRPDNWGGYLVRPVVIEFWQGRPSRLHDRLQYTLEDDGRWKMERLGP